MKRRWVYPTSAILILLAIFATTLDVQAQDAANASSDPLLQAMKMELDRSKASLKLDHVGSPYYIEYRVFDVDNFDAEAAFGAVRYQVRGRMRFLRVVVRIGDYKQDSYFQQGLGAFNVIPIENDLIALRHQLWEATDQAYKAAAQALTAKQAQLKQYSAPEQPVDDFAHADPLQSVGPLAKLDFDPHPWLAMLQDASGVYQNDPLLQSDSTRLKFQAINRYLVNTEGTMVRSGYNSFGMFISLSTQASDGMRLERSYSDTLANMNELPTAAAFHAQAVQLAGTLKLLRDAPLADEQYRGPVLFSADAASTIFSDFVGENILGRKPELGKNARTTGEFAASYKNRVLPEFLSVVDDPTLATFAGHALLGNYAIDDEGVRAQRTSVIEKGKLVNYLVGREPIRDFPASNGHGRARVPANPAGPSLGNLIISASESSSPADLKKKLIEICQQHDLPYGYYVETLGPQRTPRLLYKIWVKDGREELVRGGMFGDLDSRAIRSDLIAAGNDVNVANHDLNIPHSIVSPSILFDELEVKRVNANQDKLPEYPAPPLMSAK